MHLHVCESVHYCKNYYRILNAQDRFMQSSTIWSERKERSSHSSVRLHVQVMHDLESSEVDKELVRLKGNWSFNVKVQSIVSI